MHRLELWLTSYKNRCSFWLTHVVTFNRVLCGYPHPSVRTNGFRPRYQKPNLIGPKNLKIDINPYLWTRGRPPKPFTCMLSMEETLGFQCLRHVQVLAFKVLWPFKIPSHNLSTTLLHGIVWSLFHIFSNPNCV
jgi:hypothetical protein